MPDTTSNVILEIFGNTANFATDYGTIGTGFTDSHIQIFKVAYGTEDGLNTRVSENYPFPVKIYGVTGSDLMGITGTVSGTGSFIVVNKLVDGSTVDYEYLMVAGSTNGAAIGVSGSIEGISGGFPVGVSGNVNVLGEVFIVGPTASWVLGFGGSGETAYNPIVVTGGRPLTPDLDTVGVTGTVTVNGGRVLAAGTDSVKVYGSDAGTKVLTRLYSSDGTTIGVSGDALNVNVIGAGISADVTLSATIAVTNESGTALIVQGYTGSTGYPVTVRGENSGAVEVVATNPLSVTISGSGITANNDTIVGLLGTAQNGVLQKLTDIKTDTATITTLNTNFTSGVYSVKVSELTKPNTFNAGTFTAVASNGAAQLTSNTVLKSGVTIKASLTNTAPVYVGTVSLTRNVLNGYPLDPGETLFLEVNNLNLIYIRSGSGTQSINYIGS